MVVVGVEDLGDHLRHGLVLRGLEILPPGIEAHIHRLWGLGIPQTQGVGVAGVVSGDLHVAWNGQHRGAALLNDVEVPVVPKLPQGTAKADLLGLLGLWQEPGGADALPVVGQLHLLALHYLLLENTQIIADGISRGGNFQRAHRIQIAGRETAQPAVSKSRVRLQLEDVSRLKAEMLQRFLQLGQNPQIESVLLKAPAHQKFQRQIMHLPLSLSARLLPGLHASQSHGVPQNQRAGAEHLRLPGLLRGLPEVDHQLRGQGVFQFLCCKCGHSFSLSAISSFLSAGPFLWVAFFVADLSAPGLLTAVFFAAAFFSPASLNNLSAAGCVDFSVSLGWSGFAISFAWSGFAVSLA
ncbi:hypothetical protein SDC9_129457 [bioreactor metagenome]|uniref:Uncharacterized protein n=1 Tax=bioreactor metagenome TaxID=1076179 RepID=A0A645CZ16_9ZZZZ